MKQKLAKLISFIFHPIIFSVLLPFIIIYHRSSSIFYGLEWTIFTTLFVVGGLVLFFFLKPKDLLEDFDLSKKSRRPIFYTVALLFAVLYFIVAIIFKGIFFPLSIIALGIILGIVLFELVNFFIKASIHEGVISAYVITFGFYFGFLAFLSVCWIPFAVGWSRVFLRKHTITEIIVGAIIGSLVTLITFAIAQVLV